VHLTTVLLFGLFLSLCSCDRVSGGPPTPVGVLGLRDLREPAPADAPVRVPLDPGKASGHVLPLGERGHGVKLRVLAWDECIDPLCLKGSRPVGVGVEVMENPNGAVVKWNAPDAASGAKLVPLDMDVEWVDGGHIKGLSLRGGVDFADGAVWKPTQ